MKIYTRLLLNKNKNESKQPPVSTEKKQVEVISANDGIKFDADGLPVEFTLDIHQITKKAYTPSAIYDEPAYYPWAEQARHNTLVAIQQQPENINSLQVYNGYPVEVLVNDTTRIVAINNCGDYYFILHNYYDLTTGTGETYCKGKVVKVLDCNTYTNDVILRTQSQLFYLQLNKGGQ